MSGNLCHQGGGGRRPMAKTILNFHFDYLNPSLIQADYPDRPDHLHNSIQPSTVHYSPAQPRTSQYGPVQSSAGQYIPVQPIILINTATLSHPNTPFSFLETAQFAQSSFIHFCCSVISLSFIRTLLQWQSQGWMLSPSSQGHSSNLNWLGFFKDLVDFS